MRVEVLHKNIDELLEVMPWYVQEYYHAKMAIPLSFRTMYEYLKEYKRFFTWLIDAGVCDATKIKAIDLVILEKLKKKDLEAYITYIRFPNDSSAPDRQRAGRQLSQVTVKRTITAISSLYTYLTEQTEDEEGEPYFYRNVTKKIVLKAKRPTLQARANTMKSKLILDEDVDGLLTFIDEGYEKNLSKRALATFQRDRERDLAIIALFLATGIRLSEAVNIDLKDLNLANMNVEVTRKGDKRDVVTIAGFAKPYLENYLSIRKSKYKATTKPTAPLFVTIQNKEKEARRLGERSIEKLVGKYTEAYKVRVSPHKLRHSLATRLYSVTKDPVMVSQQLGHADGNTDLIGTYVHVVNDKTEEALDKL